jgi:AcrR family transcriptional regulator
MMQPKERILVQASVLFHKQGYNSTGINQIIEEAKVAKASFYQHFKSKEDLGVAFLNRRHFYWFEELQNFTSDKNNQQSKVISSFDFLIFMNEKENFRGCSFLNLLSEIPSDNIKILQVIQNHKSDLRNYFLDILKDTTVANHVYLLFESCIIESQLFKSNELIEQSKMIIKTLILE